MTGRDAALALLQGWHAPDPDQERLRGRFVSHLERHPDGLDRRCFPDHLTASTLVVSADHTEVLLTLHAKAQAWFQLGGHCEPADASLADGALREAVEESGLGGLTLDPRPLQLDAHAVPFCSPRGTVHHLDVRFLAVAPEGSSGTASAESLELAWWPIDALPTREPGILRLVRLARQRLAGQSTGSSAAI